MVFALVIGDTLDDAASLDPDRSGELDFSGHGAALAVTLFLARPDGLRVAEVSEVIRAAATDELPPAQAEKAWQSWVRAHGDPARLLLDLMAELEAIQIADAEDGPVARLTPLGLAAIRTQLVDSGVEIPLLPDAEHMTAAQLIAMADGASEEEFSAETAAWLSHRIAEPAARELLAVAAESDPASRLLAVGVVLTELGALAEPVWREVLDRIELRGYAKAALAALSGGDPAAAPLPGLEPDDHDLAWMITDALAAEGWDDLSDDAGDEPEALAKRLGEAIPAGQEPAVFELDGAGTASGRGGCADRDRQASPGQEDRQAGPEVRLQGSDPAGRPAAGPRACAPPLSARDGRAGFRYRHQAPRRGLRLRRGRGPAAHLRRPDSGRTRRHGGPARRRACRWSRSSAGPSSAACGSPSRPVCSCRGGAPSSSSGRPLCCSGRPPRSHRPAG